MLILYLICLQCVGRAPEGVRPVRYPVTLGVPFPAGALWDADRVRVVNQAGESLPHQKEVTGLWAPDGSVKWMRFDALVAPQDGCFVEFGRRLCKAPLLIHHVETAHAGD